LGGATVCVSSVAAEPNPSHPAGAADTDAPDTGAPDTGPQSVPSEQQFASISAANRNTMHFEIIAVTYSVAIEKT
jgi:hypothetical protein